MSARRKAVVPRRGMALAGAARWGLPALLALLVVVAGARAGERVAVFDLGAALASHPLRLRFDAATRRFSDTPSAFLDAARLASVGERLAAIEAAMASLDRQGEDLVRAQVGGQPLAEQAFWERWRQLRQQRARATAEREGLAAIVAAGGKTPATSIRPCVATIVADVTRAWPPGTLTLNHLPPATSWAVGAFADGNPLALAIFDNDPSRLAGYLRQAYGLSYLVPQLCRPVVVDRASPEGGRP